MSSKKPQNGTGSKVHITLIPAGTSRNYPKKRTPTALLNVGHVDIGKVQDTCAGLPDDRDTIVRLHRDATGRIVQTSESKRQYKSGVRRHVQGQPIPGKPSWMSIHRWTKIQRAVAKQALVDHTGTVKHDGHDGRFTVSANEGMANYLQTGNTPGQNGKNENIRKTLGVQGFKIEAHKTVPLQFNWLEQGIYPCSTYDR